jgi:hypothetical protein
MHAHYLFFNNLRVAPRTIDRIEPAPVSAIAANVTIAACRRAMRGALKERHINFVAIIARMFLLLGADRLKHEQHAGKQDS